MKTKDFSLEIKAVSDEGTFEGYGSVFGVKDSYNEVVEPGAFVASLAKHKREGTTPALLWQHRADQPIGVWTDMAEDGKGLWAEGRLLKDDVAQAREVYALLRAKAVRGMSIGYYELEAEPDKDRGVRLLKKLDLVEVSIVTFAANPRARVEAVKNERMEDFARRLRDGEPPPIKEFEDLLREVGIPKSMAVQIASVGYAKAIRSESEGQANTDAAARIAAFAASLRKAS